MQTSCSPQAGGLCQHLRSENLSAPQVRQQITQGAAAATSAAPCDGGPRPGAGSEPPGPGRAHRGARAGGGPAMAGPATRGSARRSPQRPPGGALARRVA